MSITVGLVSSEFGVIRNFFKHLNESELSEEIVEWVYVYKDINDAKEMMEKVVKSKENQDISLWVKIKDKNSARDLTYVTLHNLGQIYEDISMLT